MTKERHIHSCTSYSEGCANLKGVEFNFGVSISMDLPDKIGRQLIGYQCVVEGGVGDICKIVKWFDLPPTHFDQT